MIKFVITDPLYYEAELIKAYERLTGRVLQPADPERLIINLIAYAMTITAINIDESARQNLLAYAEKDKLDALAEFYGISRLPAQPAMTTLRFSLSQPQNFPVIIPQGTRATADNKVIFATATQAVIPEGESFVDVKGVATEPGQIGNGYQIGQINSLVDPVPYVAAVTNISISMYGADMESDERFRERLRLSLERFSTAGPKFAYVFHTKSVHQDIEDVEVFSPQPGVVKIVCILKDGALPDSTMLETISSKVSSEKVRPLTDMVIVSAPQVITYDISMTYYIHKKDEAIRSHIQSSVEKALQDFILWTKTKIGRDILPEELIKRVKDAGAYRVVLTEPAYRRIEIDQVGHNQNVSINYGGIVED